MPKEITKDMKAKRAALYMRVSTQIQETKAQEVELREYTNHRGWSIARVYADKVSGTRFSVHPHPTLILLERNNPPSIQPSNASILNMDYGKPM